MLFIALFVTVTLLGMIGITLSNLLLFPKLRISPSPPRRGGEGGRGDEGVLISVLIPARDEAAIIGETVQRLLAQAYPRFELVVLDDHSTDGTAQVARAAAGGDARLRIIEGAALPAGWGGKNWACHQLAQVAEGEWLVFADADTAWAPDALAAIAAEMARTRADLLTVWPTQITGTWAERLVVPLMALTVISYLPVFMVHFTPWAPFAAATGQCLVFRRVAYDAIGGHAALKGEVLEDVKFARRIKGRRLRLRMVDGNGLVACRMYYDWPGVRDGYAKNILAGYGSLVGLALATVFHWLVFLWPWVWLAAAVAGYRLQVTGYRLQVAQRVWLVWPMLLVMAGIGLRATSAWFTRQRARDALLLPVSVLLMTVIAAKSAYWQIRFGGPVWKGRILRGK